MNLSVTGQRTASRRASGLGRWVLVAPLAALVAIFLVWPLVDVMLRSVSPEGSLGPDTGGFTMDHYRAIVDSSVLRLIVVETLRIALLATIVTLIASFPVAYLMSRLTGRLASIMLVLVMTPFWVSILVRLFATQQILGRQGVINYLFGLIGMEPRSLLFNTLATVIGMAVYLVPYMVLMLYAGMAGVDTTLVTAARTLGASRSRAFLTIYLPQLRSTIVGATLLVFVLSGGFFLTPAILGGPRNVTIATYIQQQINIGKWGVASAVGIVLLVVTLAGYLLALRLGGRSLFVVSNTTTRRGAQEPLSRSPGTFALVLFSFVVIGALLLPLAIVIPSSFGSSPYLSFPPSDLTLRWFGEVLGNDVWRGPLLKSLWIGLGSAAVAVIAGLIAAHLVTQVSSRRVASLIYGVCYAPLIVPVVLLAIGIYDTELKMSLDGTAVGLILPHAVLALPFTFTVFLIALGNLDPSLEPAAQSLGAPRWVAFLTVVLPNITVALLGAFVVGFVTSWDEVVIALFQVGFNETLPVAIYAQIKSGVTPEVSAVATLLILTELLLVLALVCLPIVARSILRALRGTPSN